MVFFFLIVLPFIVPLVYFIDLRLVFVMYENWYWLLTMVLALDFVYFLLLYVKNKSKFKWLLLFFTYSVFFIGLGFGFNLILAENSVIGIFSFVWPLFLLIFLYATLHFSYETSKLPLIDIKNIIPYVNVASVFILSALLINLNIYLAIPWWVVLPIFVVCFFTFNLPFLYLYLNNFKNSVYFSLVLTILTTEIMIVALYLPTSFYVLAAIVALIYYLFLILLKKKFEGLLQKKDIIKHLIFVAVLSILILSTSKWI